MPYKSIAQERYFNANRDKLERQGVDVDEWNQASMSALDVLGIEAEALYAKYPEDAVLYVDSFRGATTNREEAMPIPVWDEEGNICGMSLVRIGRDGSLVEERQ